MMKVPAPSICVMRLRSTAFTQGLWTPITILQVFVRNIGGYFSSQFPLSPPSSLTLTLPLNIVSLTNRGSLQKLDFVEEGYKGCLFMKQSHSPLCTSCMLMHFFHYASPAWVCSQAIACTIRIPMLTLHAQAHMHIMHVTSLYALASSHALASYSPTFDHPLAYQNI